MAVYNREPINGGDSNVWGPKEQNQNHAALGAGTSILYDNSGVLTLSPGKIGIDTGSGKGIISVESAEIINFASIPNSRWFYVECVVSAATATFQAVEIAAGTDPAILPATFTGAFDGTKGGFYITSSRRVIGLGWKSSGGDLEGVVNTLPFIDGWSGISQSNDTVDLEYTHFQINQPFSEPTIQAAADITIPDLTQDLMVVFSGLSSIGDCTLPAVANNTGRTIKIINLDSTYRVDAEGAGSEKINGYDRIGLPSLGNYIKLYCDGSSWYALDFNITYETGWINTTDWTARELGSTAAPINTDSSINHTIGLPIASLNINLFYSPTGVDSDSILFQDTSSSGSRGFSTRYSDLNNVILATSGSGIAYVSSGHTVTTLAADNAYYNARVSVKCI